MIYYIRLTTIEEVQKCLDYVRTILKKKFLPSSYTKGFLYTGCVLSKWPYISLCSTDFVFYGTTEDSFTSDMALHSDKILLINDVIQKNSDLISIF